MTPPTGPGEAAVEPGHEPPAAERTPDHASQGAGDTSGAAALLEDTGAAELPASSQQAREVEAKLTTAVAAQVDRLAVAPTPLPGFTLGTPRHEEVRDTYLDTKSFDLLRSGYALRVRERDTGPPEVALKGLPRREAGAIHDRFEFQGAVDVGCAPRDPQGWPVPVRAMVEYLGARDAVAPLLRIAQRRVERSVADERAPEPWALLSVDSVRVLEPDPVEDPSSGWDVAPAVAELGEVEAELLAGASPGCLDDLVAALEHSFPVAPPEGSKFERGLRALADRPPRAPGAPPVAAAHGHGIQPAMEMAEAGRLIWRHQLTAMVLNEAGARRGDDIEYVHDMRVATRRARAAARIFGDFFDSDTLKPILKGLKRTAKTLGRVRDLDVALDKLDRSQGDADADLDELAATWRQERVEAYRKLEAWLDSGAYRRFLVRLGEVTRTHGLGARQTNPKPGQSPRPHQVRHVFPPSVAARYAQVRSYETLLDDASTPVETLHALRIDCKRMRYTLEPISHLLGDDGAYLIKTLKRLQTALGELNDGAVARSRLLQLVAEGAGGPGAADYIEQQESEIERWRGKLEKRWQPFVSEAYRQALFGALSRL